VLDRGALLQQGPVRGGRGGAADLLVDVGGRAGGGGEADRQEEGRVRRLPAGAVLRVLQDAQAGGRRVPVGGRQEGRVQQPRRGSGGRVAGVQGRQGHAHRGGDRRHRRLRHQP